MLTFTLSGKYLERDYRQLLFKIEKDSKKMKQEDVLKAHKLINMKDSLIESKTKFISEFESITDISLQYCTTHSSCFSIDLSELSKEQIVAIIYDEHIKNIDKKLIDLGVDLS